jgi:hypothetical protein
MLSALANLPAYPISWFQLKGELVTALETGRPVSPQRDFALPPRGRRDSWLGVSAEETLDWLRNGYQSEGLRVKSPSPYERSYKTRWNDWDGDPDIGRAVAGFDRYYFGRSPYQSKPALTVNFEYYFSAALPHSTIAEFGGWLAQLFTALEQRGFSLAVNAVAGISRSDPHRVELRVKNHGERADYTDWSAIFSPAGYRVIMFAAIIRACELGGSRAQAGLGGPFTTRPVVELADDVLHISCGNKTFDRARMDEMLAATGLLS